MFKCQRFSKVIAHKIQSRKKMLPIVSMAAIIQSSIDLSELFLTSCGKDRFSYVDILPVFFCASKFNSL